MLRGEQYSSDAGVHSERLPLSIAEKKLSDDLRLLGHFYLRFHEPFYQRASGRVDAYGEVGHTVIVAQQHGDYNDPEAYTIKQYDLDGFVDHHPNPHHTILTWTVDQIQLHQEETWHERHLLLQSATDDDLTAKLTLRGSGNEWQSATERGLIDCARMVAVRAMYHFQKKYRLTADELIEKIRADGA